MLDENYTEDDAIEAARDLAFKSLLDDAEDEAKADSLFTRMIAEVFASDFNTCLLEGETRVGRHHEIADFAAMVNAMLARNELSDWVLVYCPSPAVGRSRGPQAALRECRT